jgi:D-mannonate dehydratase
LDLYVAHICPVSDCVSNPRLELLVRGKDATPQFFAKNLQSVHVRATSFGFPLCVRNFVRANFKRGNTDIVESVMIQVLDRDAHIPTCMMVMDITNGLESSS